MVATRITGIEAMIRRDMIAKVILLPIVTGKELIPLPIVIVAIVVLLVEDIQINIVIDTSTLISVDRGNAVYLSHQNFLAGL